MKLILTLRHGDYCTEDGSWSAHLLCANVVKEIWPEAGDQIEIDVRRKYFKGAKRFDLAPIGDGCQFGSDNTYVRISARKLLEHHFHRLGVFYVSVV